MFWQELPFAAAEMVAWSPVGDQYVLVVGTTVMVYSAEVWKSIPFGSLLPPSLLSFSSLPLSSHEMFCVSVRGMLCYD